MNIYGLIILITLGVESILSLISDLLNLKHLDPELPESFSDVYDESRYRRSQEYTRVNTRFGFITTGFDLTIILLFWFLGGFNYVDLWVRQFNLAPVWSGLIYIGVLMLGKTILSLPFSIYSTFVIEEKFGFNKTTPKTFILDMVKGLLLSIVIGGPILAGILAFFQYTGSLAWLYCCGFATVVTLMLQYVAPTWIMPLFNKFTPLEDGELKNTLMDYAQKVKYKLSGIFVMDGSKRSSKSNAFFTGFGKNKRIALFDTLITKHTVSELLTVLAHEIGHYKKKHILINMVISVLHTGILFYLISIFLSRQGLYDAFYMENMSIYTGFIFFGMLYSPIELILSIFMGMSSRHHEYQADRFAVETTRQPDSFIDALRKLSRDNLSNLTPHPFYVFLNYSHAPVLKRIEAIRKT